VLLIIKTCEFCWNNNCIIVNMHGKTTIKITVLCTHHTHDLNYSTSARAQGTSEYRQWNQRDCTVVTFLQQSRFTHSQHKKSLLVTDDIYGNTCYRLSYAQQDLTGSRQFPISFAGNISCRLSLADVTESALATDEFIIYLIFLYLLNMMHNISSRRQSALTTKI
jgi:hypothetical protein